MTDHSTPDRTERSDPDRTEHSGSASNDRVVSFFPGDDSRFDPLEEEILSATYSALSIHGYSDLTMQAIADEFEKSKSLLYYHYDGKDELLADFLEYALQQFLADLQVEHDTPVVQLRTLVDRLLPETLADDRRQVQVALLELRAEAPHSERHRQQYTRLDRELEAFVTDVIRRGKREGSFADVDPELEAELLVSTLYGARTRRLTTYEEFPVERPRAAIEAHLDRLQTDRRPDEQVDDHGDDR